MFENSRLSTRRLLLRAPVLADADSITRIASDPRVALTTASIPHPYPDNGAVEFIERIHARAGRDRRNFAIILASTDELVGMIGFAGDGLCAELTYMIAPLHWGHGLATEAGRAVMRHLFDDLEYCAVAATAMMTNPASERVLHKLGFANVGEEVRDVPLRGDNLTISCWRLKRPAADEMSVRSVR